MSVIKELVEDETGAVSTARVGIWVTVVLAAIAIGVDIFLSLHQYTVQVPNTVYTILATMFTVFASWAGGARVAQYFGPQIGSIVQGIGSSKQKETIQSHIESTTEKLADDAEKFVANTWKTGNPEAGAL